MSLIVSDITHDRLLRNTPNLSSHPSLLLAASVSGYAMHPDLYLITAER